MRATVRSAASAAAAIAVASSGVRSARPRRASVPSASAAATSRAGPPFEPASRRISTALPYRRSSCPKPTGPMPRTPARTAQACRSSIPGVGGAVGPCAGVRVSSAWCEAAPIGPSTPTPSMSARLDGREPHVGRPIPGRFVEVIGLDRRGAREIGDRPCDPQQAFRAAATRPFELGEDHDPPFRARPQEARLAQSPAGEAAVERAARPVRARRDARPRPGRRRRPSPPGPARERGPSARRAASRSTGRSGRGAGRRRVAGTAPAPASGRRTDDPDVPAKPHGHGFIAATSWNRAGKLVARPAREMATRPASIGCRSASRTSRSNSGSSSRNSTPWSARVTSPGERCGPPPTMAA